MRPGARRGTWMFLGAVVTLCLLANSVLSPMLAAEFPIGEVFPHEARVFRALSASLEPLGPVVVKALHGDMNLEPLHWWMLASAPLALSSIVFVVLLVLLARWRDQLDPGLPALLFKWGVVFACVSFFAFPWQTNDIWLSVVWGTMVVEGLNPYHQDAAQWMLRDIPVDTYMRMTYGPLWASLISVMMWVGSGAGLLAGWIIKLPLLAAWIASLKLVWKLLRGRPVWHQCVGIATFGWLPLSVFMSVAEAHNDIVMVLFILLWLRSMENKPGITTSLFLAAAVLTKYVAAPLFILDVLSCYKTRGSLGAYLPRALAAAGLCVLTFAPFYRSPDFFDATLGMSFGFFRPVHALNAALEQLGNPLRVALPTLKLLLVGVFPAIASWHVLRYFAQPNVDRSRAAAFSIMAAMVFSAVGHIWPWFLLWGLPFVVLIPRAAFARWYIGIAIGYQFLLPTWQVYAQNDRILVFRTALLVAYLVGFAWLCLSVRFLPPAPPLARAGRSAPQREW